MFKEKGLFQRGRKLEVRTRLVDLQETQATVQTQVIERRKQKALGHDKFHLTSRVILPYFLFTHEGFYPLLKTSKYSQEQLHTERQWC